MIVITIGELSIGKKLKCPAATQDLELNTKNRDAAIKAEHIQYGPLNVDEPGDYWKDRIAKAMSETDFILVCLSNNSINKTGYFQRELKTALELQDFQPRDKALLIPIRLDDFPIPYELRDIHCQDIFPDYKNARI